MEWFKKKEEKKIVEKQPEITTEVVPPTIKLRIGDIVFGSFYEYNGVWCYQPLMKPYQIRIESLHSQEMIKMIYEKLKELNEEPSKKLD